MLGYIAGLFAALLLGAASPASAAGCDGQFPASTVCGNRGTAQARPGPIAARTQLVGNVTYSVCPSGCRFTTIAAAVSFVANSIDLGGFGVVINALPGCASGAFTTPINIRGPWVGWGTVAINGDVATPSNCLIQTTGASAVTLENSSNLILNGFKIVTITSGDSVSVDSHSNFLFSHLDFGASAGTHISLVRGGIAHPFGDYTISGNPVLSHIHMPTPAFYTPEAININLVGTPSWGAYFIGMRGPGYADFNSVTRTGTNAIGGRSVIHIGAVLDQENKPVDFLPGDGPLSQSRGGMVAAALSTLTAGQSTRIDVVDGILTVYDGLGNMAMISYFTNVAAPVVVAQIGSAFVVGADPGVGSDKWWVQPGGLFTSRFTGFAGLKASAATLTID